MESPETGFYSHDRGAITGRFDQQSSVTCLKDHD